MRFPAHISIFDKAAMIAAPILATVVSDAFGLTFLQSTLLFFAVPSIYLSLRNPRLIKTTLIFSLIMGLTMLFVFDHMAYLDASWYVPNSMWRFLRDSIPFEDGPWAVLLVYYVVITWEYFFFTPKKRHMFNPNIIWFIVFCASLLIVFFIIYVFSPNSLVVPYFYFKLGIFFEMIPIAILLLRRPHIIKPLLYITVYFFFMSLLAEYVGLVNNQWYFSGEHYIGEIQYFGHRLPWDEILFWWLLAAPGMVTWYESFATLRNNLTTPGSSASPRI